MIEQVGLGSSEVSQSELGTVLGIANAVNPSASNNSVVHVQLCGT